MKKVKQFTAAFLTLILFGIGLTANGQMQVNNQNVMYLIKRLETNTDQFSDNLEVKKVNAADEDMAEILIKSWIAGFEYSTDRLRDRVEDNEVIASDIEDILSRALIIDKKLSDAKISADARADWMRIKSNLNDLAKAYNVVWIWDLKSNATWNNPVAAERVVDRLENRTDEFRRSLDYALDSSRFNGTKIEDSAIELADAFEDQVDRWEDLSDNDRLSSANLRTLLQKAAALDAFLHATDLSMRAKRDWAQVKANLDVLAMMASFEWNWSATPVAVK